MSHWEAASEAWSRPTSCRHYGIPVETYIERKECDFSIDVLAIPVGKQAASLPKVAIECKYMVYDNIGPEGIARFVQVWPELKRNQVADAGLVVTKGAGFTPGAQRLAEKVGIQLCAYETLSQWIRTLRRAT